ncbi:MAG: phosphate acetyltransferase [Bryobacterales bacterium]|nr:phosphate acetyltransferase [Bryobacterales bacterium]
MAGVVAKARTASRRIVFPESRDARVVEAARRLAADGVLRPILVGPPPDRPPEGVTFADPAQDRRLERYAALLYERRRHKGMTRVEAEATARQPLYFAALMVAAGDADGSVGGAASTTADTVRAAIHSIGVAPGSRLVSSFYVMALHDRGFGHRGLMAFGDCSVVVEPSPSGLAEIAMATASSARTLLGVEPAVALLSFSTKGSARHKQVDHVVEALRIVQARAPELHIDGELQADAALAPLVAQSKAPGSTVAGRANVLIFPNLAAGNIAYKMMERLCGAAAIGPFLQGLAHPANDLSRGASVEDIYHTAAVTAVQSVQP